MSDNTPQKPVIVRENDEMTEMQKWLYDQKLARIKRDQAQERQLTATREINGKVQDDQREYNRTVKHFEEQLRPNMQKSLSSFMTAQTLLGDLLEYSNALRVIYGAALSQQLGLIEKREGLKLGIKEALRGLKNKVSSSDEPITLPTLTHLISVGKNGVLDSSLKISQNMTPTAQETADPETPAAKVQATYNLLIENWLQSQGCSIQQGPNNEKIVHNPQGVVITSEEFKALRDGDKGFNQYLKEKCGVCVEQAPEVAPTTPSPLRPSPF